MEKLEGLQAVLFDWDGTLWDSVGVVFGIYRDMFLHNGLPPLEENDFKNKFKSNYHEYYRLMGLKAPPSELDALWIKLYRERAELIGPINGALEAVSYAKSRGLKTALVSDGSGERIKEEIRVHRFEGFLDVVVTDEEVREFKPNPKRILYALDALGVEPENAVYLGDMDSDVMAGKAAGTKAIGVLTGFHSRQRLAPSKPDRIIRSVVELKEII